MGTQFKGWMRDAALILALFSFSYVMAMHYLSNLKEQQYYQYLFEPAVMFACDKGFISMQGEQVPELKSFLALKTQTFDCKYLPKTMSASSYPAVKAWYYLLLLTAFMWKIFGIAWENINILISGLFSLTVILSYGLFMATK